MIKYASKKIEDLKRKEVLLTQVRKVHNTDPTASSTGTNYKVQITCAEYINNPFRKVNAASVFNSGDSRFVGQKPRFGWVTLEPKMWELFFGTIVPLKAIEALDFSSSKDIDDPSKRVEGTHFITVNLLNPKVNFEGEEFELHVRIIETLKRRNDQQPQKLNPKDDSIQTVGKHPIYSNGQVVFGRQESKFLFSDQMAEAVAEGRLDAPDAEVMERYNAEVKALNALIENQKEIEIPVDDKKYEHA